MKFKQQFTFEQRIAEAERIVTKYPDRIPVICELNENSVLKDFIKSQLKMQKKTPFELDKKKYLIPSDFTIGQFMYVIRKRLKLPSEKAVFLFCNNFIPSSTTTITSLYNSLKDKDKFLYLNYGYENTFGTGVCPR